MKIATFNVNSIKKRLPAVLDWLAEQTPDILVLQEIKCETAAFPEIEIAEAGYQAIVSGQKAYNGVAILGKVPMTLRQERLPGDHNDEQARYLEIEAQETIICGLYLPNGNPVMDEDSQISAKFRYKLNWLDRLIAHVEKLLLEEKSLVITGDFNIIPTPEDCYDIQAWRDDALYHPETLKRFHQLQHLGFWDSWRTLHPDRRAYSFWDYQKGRWQKGEGIRIDHLMLSPLAAERLIAAEIDETPRGQPQPSDHTPVWCEIE